MLALLATLAFADPTPSVDGTTIQRDGGRILVQAVPGDLRPGGLVAVYVAEARPDPRGGDQVGLRYAGDAVVTWVGVDLVALELLASQAPAAGEAVVLGPPTGLAPTARWAPPTPPEPAPAGPVAGLDSGHLTPVYSPREHRPNPVVVAVTSDADHRPLGSTHDRAEPHPQALTAWGGFAGTGYGTGLGAAGLTWSFTPAHGPGRVAIGLEGTRSRRWVAGTADEPSGQELAAGYWLWTDVDGAGVGLAVLAGAGIGVDVEGLAIGARVGLRCGDPRSTHVDLVWEGRQRFGYRLTLDGRAALSDAWRIGLRTRLGDAPKPVGSFRAQRADTALTVDWDVGDRLRLGLAGGVGGYDLLLADAGVVADGNVEVRW
jgi:hypothetical protein